ncbi:MAG: hypothetical protein KIT84_37140 [Labilithrix sp.]|nr:hypothetical protein [Labilithrix sp.]MCW5816684.1 hypothetical protein [Labilithrix sp.]
MVNRPEKPFAGVGLKAAAKMLAGHAAPELDVDWLGIDENGAIAVFLGGDETPVPSGADPDATSAALERIAESMRRRLATEARSELAYRAAASRAGEPVFDVPTASFGDPSYANGRGPLHEPPARGYPHLVFAWPGAETTLRAFFDGASEVLTRGDHFAVRVDSMRREDAEELHRDGTCAGCRVVDDPNDPRSRSAHALASAGLYVYGWTPEAWVRVASPSVPADRGDLQDVGGGKLLALPHRFESSAWLPHDPQKSIR